MIFPENLQLKSIIKISLLVHNFKINKMFNFPIKSFNNQQTFRLSLESLFKVQFLRTTSKIVYLNKAFRYHIKAPDNHLAYWVFCDTALDIKESKQSLLDNSHQQHVVDFKSLLCFLRIFMRQKFANKKFSWTSLRHRRLQDTKWTIWKSSAGMDEKWFKAGRKSRRTRQLLWRWHFGRQWRSKWNHFGSK